MRRTKRNGLVVIAERQTKGKGTNGRIWFTEEGKNLTFSFLLRPDCNIQKLQNLTITIAEVMIRIIQEIYGYTLDIKYPNDIVKSGKKLRRNFNRELYKRRNNKQYNYRNRTKYKSNKLRRKYKRNSNFFEKGI